jgi:UDP-2,3-diacylglucosamine pyrophosphatase LpxH
MIIVLSDLHFSEAQSTQIGDHRFNRNLPPDAYWAYFAEINQFAKANQIDKIDLVLAGDILEISRSGFWLDCDHRPYINNDAVLPDSEVEGIILRILDGIANEEKVKETLDAFRNLQAYFDMEVELHLILGNHDRLANATPNIRKKVWEMFGIMNNSDRIENFHVFKYNRGDPFCLIRHGHEYDPTNFSINVRKLENIPTAFSREAYDRAVLGDITTSEFGAALSWLFKKQHGEETILLSKKRMALYQRLMEFDDVRPTTAWLAYLFSTPGVKKKKTWKLIKPAFTRIINNLAFHEPLHKTLKQSQALNPLFRFLLMGLLRSGIFKNGIPYWLMKRLMKIVSKNIKVKSQVKWAKREALLQAKDATCKCVVSGHTHFAEVSLITAKKQNEQYYINTGTWRNVIPATRRFKHFGRLKALTKVILFYPQEKSELPTDQDWAFQYLSGVSYGEHRHLIN